MKILLFLEHSAIVRHFVDSKAFSKLEKKHKVIYVLPFGHKRLGKLKKNDLKINPSRIINLPVHQKRVSLWGSRFSIELLRNQKGWNKYEKNTQRVLFKSLNPRKLYLFYRFLGLPIIFNLFKFILNIKLKKNRNIPLENLIKSEKPDLIIHPSVLSGVYINDLVDEGNKSSVPVVVIMNSWDNPSSKRCVVSNDYWLLVWGPQTKMHALKMMNMPEEKIIEFGAAQFDIYKQLPKNSKEKILKYHEVINPKIPTILYAGSSKSTDEFSHLEKIDHAINLNQIPKVNIIYRPHPWGEACKESIKFKNHNFRNIVIDKNMKNYLFNNKNNEAFYSSKYSDTRDLLYAVDAVISPLSTILIESMIMGKHPLCFMPIEEKGASHFQNAENSIHFKELLSLKEIIVIWGGEKLIDGVANLIKKMKKNSLSKDLTKASNFFVKNFDRSFNERIVDLVEEIPGKSN